MAKKKKHEDLPEGMSRRQAKLAKRAAERAQFEKVVRPFEGFVMEADLVALQEFVPSALAPVTVAGTDKKVYLGTVLPGAGAGVVREDGTAIVALQVSSHSQNPHKDLAYALAWARDAQPGDTLQSTAADGSQPELSELLSTTAALTVEAFDDFSWWFPNGTAGLDPQMQQGIQAANDAVVPSVQLAPELPGSLWWVNPGGGKAHIRWVRTDSENQLLKALARIAARGELNLGENTKFAGAFRTHGLLVPVFDLDPSQDPESFVPELERLNDAAEQELENDAQLTAEERRQEANIKSRQVTLR